MRNEFLKHLRNIDKLLTLHRYPMDDMTVEVCYLEYLGGGECYEYQILRNGELVAFSDDGYGNAATCASHGFQWIAENRIFEDETAD